MKQGMIHETARRQARDITNTGAIALLICLAVFAFSWKHFYNVFAGPVPFTASLAANPGAHEFVSAKGQLVPTGLTQESTLKLKGVALSKHVSAVYQALQIEGRTLVAKISPEFSGTEVEGKLVSMPDDLAKALGASAKFYPWLLDAESGYRWDFNLFVFLGAIVLPFAFLYLCMGLWLAGDLRRHRAIKDLVRFGEPLQVVEKIESEMAQTGEAGRIGPLFFAPSWVIELAPSIEFFALDELGGIAREARTKKSGSTSTTKHFLIIWSKEKSKPVEIEASEAAAAAVMEKVAAVLPWTVVANGAEFAKKWTADRNTCMRDATRRRVALVGSQSH